MQTYKRSTKKDAEYGNYIDNNGSTLDEPRIAVSSNGKIYGTVIDRFAELEDKIENGTLRQFPCNIGDEVFWAWDLDKQYSQVMRGVVFGLSISHKNTVWFSVKYDDGLNFDHTIEDIGETVFLTKAKAEQKLEKLLKGDKSNV